MAEADADAAVRRVERLSVVVCVVLTVLAWIGSRGRLAAPAGVLGGGLIAAISYRGIRAGIDAVVAGSGPPAQGAEGGPVALQPAATDAETPPEGPEIEPGGTTPDREEIRPRAAAVGLVKFFTRYAILTGAAYLILARLRLPPVAVIAGASSLVLAVMVEALRSLRSTPQRKADGR